MATRILLQLNKKIEDIEKELTCVDISEWDRRWLEYKLVEAKFWLWAQLQGWEERQKARDSRG